MNATLTDATDIELESFVDGSWKQDRTDSMEINRWSKKGDRLYVNSGISKADKDGLYVDLEAHEIVSDNTSKHSGGDVTIDGDRATIIVEESGDTEHEIVVSLSGEEFETDDGDDTHECEECGESFDGEHGLAVHKGMVHKDDKNETGDETMTQTQTQTDAQDGTGLVADGGTDTTGYVDDSTIEEAIQQHDDPDEDATTVEEVRELLATLQYGVAEEGWSLYMDHIEDGSVEVVADNDGMLVLSTGEHLMYEDEIEAIHDVDDITMDVVSSVIHAVARQYSDYDWGYVYPLVVRKPGGTDAGQRYVEAVVNNLIDCGLSPGQAWAIYGVKIRGNSRNQWAARCGYSDHSAVSEAVRKGLEKLPASWSDE